METPRADSEIGAVKANAARTAVFNTAELLEDILLYLPPKQLLLVTRVSKSWQAAVQQSPSGQRVLFFRPMTDDLISWTGMSAAPHPFKSGLRSISSRNPTPYGKWSGTEHSQEKIMPVLNPVLAPFILTFWTSSFVIHNYGFVQPTLQPDIDESSGVRTAQHLHRIHYREASWRKMLLMQPPCNEMRFHCANGHGHFDVRRHHALTMQDIVEGLRAHWMLDLELVGDRPLYVWTFDGSYKKEIRSAVQLCSSRQLLAKIGDAEDRDGEDEEAHEADDKSESGINSEARDENDEYSEDKDGADGDGADGDGGGDRSGGREAS